jgi:DNA-binding winged helix-turn-helix (wHTH) protein
MIYTFGNYRLDTANYELYEGGNLCRLETRAFEVLIYLVEHRDHVVSRDELMENLWPGHHIKDEVIRNAIKAARKAIGDSGDGQHKIRTVHGRGYRFVADAQEQCTGTSTLNQSRPHNGHAPLSSVRLSVDPTAAPQDVFVGDYEFMTVLCGTLENLEALVSGLGFQGTQDLRRTFFALAQEEAERHEGTFKFFGADGFLVLFGLPVAHADHVRQSVLAGLRIQERLYESCAVLDGQPPVEATVRMGVHTGLIEIENQRDHLELTSLSKSETTALAIRLHYQARRGEFLTSKATLPYVEDMVKYVEHDAIPVPGHAQPIMVYRICGLATSSTDPR